MPISVMLKGVEHMLYSTIISLLLAGQAPELGNQAVLRNIAKEERAVTLAMRAELARSRVAQRQRWRAWNWGSRRTPRSSALIGCR